MVVPFAPPGNRLQRQRIADVPFDVGQDAIFVQLISFPVEVRCGLILARESMRCLGIGKTGTRISTRAVGYEVPALTGPG